jgi:hypothetical protein
MRRFHVMVVSHNLVEVEAEDELHAKWQAEIEGDDAESIDYKVDEITVLCEVDELGITYGV